MRKLLLIIMLLIIVSSFAVAKTTTYMRQNDRCTVVDLASAAFLSHTSASKYSGDTDVTGRRNTGFYYWPQNLAVIGFTNLRREVAEGGTLISGKRYEANGSITVKAELLTNDWCYTLNGEAGSKRPFGIDLFARAKKAGSSDMDVSGYSIHLGYQPNAVLGVDSITVPVSEVVKYDSFWWDVCLVMDPPVDTSNDSVSYNGQVYYLDRTNDYYTATIKFTATCDDEEGTSVEYYLHLAGTYFSNDYTPSNMMSILTVTPLPAASVLDISSMIEFNSVTKVANYGYTTNSVLRKNADPNGRIYLFLSNQREAISTSRFALTHISDSTSKLYYTAYLHSETQDITIPFTGEDHYTDINSNTKSNFLSISPEEITDKQNDKYLRWFDSGYISIQLDHVDDLTLYEGGIYTSNIYMHVVKDI